MARHSGNLPEEIIMLRPATKRDTPKISAIYLVKNEEEWLPLSVATIIQDVDEVVIIDTKSTDNTVALIEAMSAMNPKVKLHQWDKDFDQAFEFNCRNRALSLAANEWIMMLDADQLLSDGWHKQVEPFMKDIMAESIAVKYEHWVGSMEYIHTSFMDRQNGISQDKNIPLYQTCLFRKTPALTARAAADTCPQFKQAHHSRFDESVPYTRQRKADGAWISHCGFIKRNSMDLGIYRIRRGDYTHDKPEQDKMIAEIHRTHNGFRYVGPVVPVKYGADDIRVPSVIKHMFGSTYRIETDKDGFIQRRTFVHNGQVTP
jgi:glycosyltransferase involved in cell wall biosynthesis